MKYHIEKQGRCRILTDEQHRPVARLILGVNEGELITDRHIAVRICEKAEQLLIQTDGHGHGCLTHPGCQSGVWALRPPAYEQAELWLGSHHLQLKVTGLQAVLSEDHQIIGYLNPHSLQLQRQIPGLAVYAAFVYCWMMEDKRFLTC